MKSTLQQSVYCFTEQYRGYGISVENAIVILIIDYHDKTFKVSPQCGTTFDFEENSQQFNRWLAVSHCITEAIEFAVKELKL